MNDHSYSLVANNVAGYLRSLRGRLTEAVKLITKHQRIEATHIFVFMISSVTRNRKPYALPVQCLPIASLKDAQVRDLANIIVADMKRKQMKVAGSTVQCQESMFRLIFEITGFTTDGEFNSLRWRGNDRPLTVLQVRSNVLAKYQRKGLKAMLEMITPIGMLYYIIVSNTMHTLKSVKMVQCVQRG